VLKLFDFDKDFEIYFDASDFTIGRILVQDGKLVLFENQKVGRNEAKVANS
jgi:hypothetical protein